MKNLSDKNIAVLALLIIVVGSGAVPVSVKIGVKELSPEFFSFLRFFLASIVLIPLFFKNKVKLTKDFFWLILISLLATLNILVFSYGLKTTTATAGQLLYAVSPIFIAIYSYFLFKEKISHRKVSGIFIGILGTFLVVSVPAIQQNISFAGDLRGNILVLIGVSSYALYTSLSQKLNLKFTPLQITMAFFLTTALAMFLISAPEISQKGMQVLSMSRNSLLAVLYIGLIGTPLLYVAYQYAIKHGSPLIASINFFLVPFSTYLWANILLAEKLNPILLLGGALVLFGAYLIIRERRKN